MISVNISAIVKRPFQCTRQKKYSHFSDFLGLLDKSWEDGSKC